MADHAAAEILVGDRYRLINTLGSGGMAVVWRGFDTVLGRRVAVKILNEDLAADPMIAGRLRKEAWAVAQLTHPNIAQVYDFGSDVQPDQSSRAFVVMEVAEGQTLRSLIADGAALPWRQATAIIGQAAAALAAAHQRGIVHRDVTPSNIMVGPDGVKVLDFGIAVLLGERDSPEGTPDEVLGTPAYVAPERLRDPSGPVEPAVDVYGLGVLWYRLLTGRLPWPATSSHELLLAHLTVDPPPLPARLDLPPELADLCARCLAKDAAQRPTAAEISAAVAPYRLTAAAPPAKEPMTPEPQSTEPLAWTTSVQPRPGPAEGRSRRLAVVAAAVCGGLAAAIALPLYASGLTADQASGAASRDTTAAPMPTTPGPHVSPSSTSPVAASPSPPASADPVETATAIPVAAPPQGMPVAGIGGTAWIYCADRTTTIIEATTPSPGYGFVEGRFGPAKDVKAVFGSGPRRTEIKAKCEAGALEAQVSER